MNNFKVYDNVFTNDNCIDIIKQFRIYGCLHNNVHGQFTKGKELNNPIEYMLEDLTNKLGDNSKRVEYWYRETWTDMRCHQDINEYINKTNKQLLLPNYGHIMYISDGTYEGATFLFDNENKNVALIYPKRGRLVRFNGNTFHYVPSPFSYVLDKHIKPDCIHKRIVLLFNTWNEFISDPSVPSPYLDSIFRINTNPISIWIEVFRKQHVKLNGSRFSFRVKYMGDKHRRLGTDEIQRFYVNERFKRDGFHRGIMIYEIEKIILIDEFEEKVN